MKHESLQKEDKQDELLKCTERSVITNGTLPSRGSMSREEAWRETGSISCHRLQKHWKLDRWEPTPQSVGVTTVLWIGPWLFTTRPLTVQHDHAKLRGRNSSSRGLPSPPKAVLSFFTLITALWNAWELFRVSRICRHISLSSSPSIDLIYRYSCIWSAGNEESMQKWHIPVEVRHYFQRNGIGDRTKTRYDTRDAYENRKAVSTFTCKPQYLPLRSSMFTSLFGWEVDEQYERITTSNTHTVSANPASNGIHSHFTWTQLIAFLHYFRDVCHSEIRVQILASTCWDTRLAFIQSIRRQRLTTNTKTSSCPVGGNMNEATWGQCFAQSCVWMNRAMNNTLCPLTIFARSIWRAHDRLHTCAAKQTCNFWQLRWYQHIV